MNSYSSYSDEQLVASLKAGDESAFNEIYERYWETLLGMAFQRLKYLHEAEDVVHDIFTSLWKTRYSKDISSLGAYLAVSLKYSVLRINYRKKLFAAYSSTNNTEDMIDSGQPVEDREIYTRVRKEIATLPEKCRVIFQMSRIDGISNAEIAQKLNITGKTVENQINKAQGRLRLSLKHLLFILVALFSLLC